MGADEAFPRPADPYVAYLARMQSHHITVAMRELGRQMTIAAGLCRAWSAGWKRGYETCANNWSKPTHWTPGCGRGMP